jgi:hypothetical protein
LEHIQIQKGNDAQFRELLDMWIPYCREIGSIESDADIEKQARQRVNIQGNAKHGVESLYLTADETGGKPFWVSLGFVDSGKVDPDNSLPIYIKKIPQ